MCCVFMKFYLELLMATLQTFSFLLCDKSFTSEPDKGTSINVSLKLLRLFTAFSFLPTLNFHIMVNFVFFFKSESISGYFCLHFTAEKST